MSIQHDFREIKRLFFPRWDRENRWKLRIGSRRNVFGHCDVERQVIEIAVQYEAPDERDRLLIHEISHAAADSGHGKKWQARIEKAARRAEELGRHRLAELLREEIVNYQQAGEGLEQAYQTIQDWVTCEPDLTLAQVKRALANQYGLLLSEVCKILKRTEKVFREAKKEAMKARSLRQVWQREELQ